jgi:hypothetical protein
MLAGCTWRATERCILTGCNGDGYNDLATERCILTGCNGDGYNGFATKTFR